MRSIQYRGYTKEQALMDALFCLSGSGLNNKQKNQAIFSNAADFYLNTNDRINKIIPDLVKEGSSVLTVASSGDYLLECVFNGAKNILCFDINKLQYHVSCLKVWAIQTLSYEEFLGFFMDISSEYYLSPETFKKIITPFNKETSFTFWNEYISSRKNELYCADKLLENISSLGFIFSSLFYSDVQKQIIYLEKFTQRKIIPNHYLKRTILCDLAYDLLSLTNNSDFSYMDFIPFHIVKTPIGELTSADYLSSKENYEITKEKIQTVHIGFVNSDLLNLHKYNLPNRFDSIFLSNIPFYLPYQDFSNTIIKLLSSIKTDGGISYYHQGMKTDWFFEALKNPNFKIKGKKEKLITNIFEGHRCLNKKSDII